MATYSVTTPADAGPGSLRQAILDANANPGADSILEAMFPDEAVRPLSALPAITDRAAVSRIVIDGSAAGPGTDGLVFEAGAAGSSAGVVVRNFGGSGIVTRAANTSLANSQILDNGRGATPAPGVEVAGGTLSLLSPVTLISGNGGDGIAVTDGGAATLRHVYILRTVSSTGGNGGHGVSVSGGGRLDINALGFGTVNIGDNGGDGIHIGPGSRPGTLRGAEIGSAPAGGVRPNAGAGLRIIDSAGYRVENCQINFNRGAGISIEGRLAHGNVITGGGVFRNESHGVALLAGASDNTVGSGTLLAPNVGYNGGSGVYIAGPGTEGNVVSRCEIRNNAAGVTIDNADRNIVGGADYAARNSIFSNQGDGIEVLSGRFNRLVVNQIFNNGNLGIDLGGDGVTANDPLDADAGANDLQNHPVITSAAWAVDGIRVTGTIHTRPDTAVRIDLYANDVPTAHGRYYLGFVTVTTGPDGHAVFAATLNPNGTSNSAGLPTVHGYPANGYVVTATATARPAADAETSEFSPHLPIEGGPAARVVGVFVNSTAWQPAFRRSLSPSNPYARFGWGIYPSWDPVPPALPWVNLNEFSVRFSSDVRVAQDDLRVSGERVPRYAVTDFSYDPVSHTATWRLARPFAFDRVTLELDSGDDGVTTSLGGLPLDGEFQVGGQSGDGTPGGDFVIRRDVWRGDVTGDRRTDERDFEEVRARVNTSPRYPGHYERPYHPFYDVNGSGRIDRIDLAYVRMSMATQPPAAAAGASPGGITSRFFRPGPRTLSFSP